MAILGRKSHQTSPPENPKLKITSNMLAPVLKHPWYVLRTSPEPMPQQLSFCSDGLGDFRFESGTRFARLHHATRHRAKVYRAQLLFWFLLFVSTSNTTSSRFQSVWSNGSGTLFLLHALSVPEFSRQSQVLQSLLPAIPIYLRCEQKQHVASIL